MLLKLLLGFFVLLSFFANAQTVVIARKTHDAIYVAADSRITNFKRDINSGMKVMRVYPPLWTLRLQSLE
jgi:hypothetical protein